MRAEALQCNGGNEMDYEKEIASLHGETLAFGAIISFVLARIIQADPKMRAVIAAGFDDAANFVENFAIKAGKAASPDHTIKALRGVEELRTATIGDRGEPRRTV
jgi:hypothetical protein